MAKMAKLYRGQRSWGRETQPKAGLESSGLGAGYAISVMANIIFDKLMDTSAINLNLTSWKYYRKLKIQKSHEIMFYFKQHVIQSVKGFGTFWMYQTQSVIK